MRYLLSGLLVTCLSSICYGDGVLRLSREQIDLGDIWQGQLVDIAVTVTNVSDRQVELKGVKASCACMNVSLDTSRLEAGATSKLTAQIVRDTPGKFKHRMVVTTNNTNEQVMVTVVGNARKAYEVEGRWTKPASPKGDPEKYSALRTLPGTYTNAEMGLLVRIRGLRTNDPAAGAASSITLDSTVFKITEITPSSTEDKALQVDLRMTFKRPPEPGFYTCVVKFKIGDTWFSEECGYRILSDIWTEPRQVNFGLVSKLVKKKENVQINFREAQLKWRAAEIERVEPADCADAVGLAEQKDSGGSVSVLLELDPAKLPMVGSKSRGFFNITVFLRDSDHVRGKNKGDNGESIKLSLYGMVE